MRKPGEPIRHTRGDGLLKAADALGETVLDPKVRDALDSYRRLNSDEARARFVDHFLSRSAGALNRMWPVFYEMLKVCEERKLYADPKYMTTTYPTFQDYFEARVGKSFDTWAELESTYQFVHQNRPELFGETLAEANQRYREAKVDAANVGLADAADQAEQRPPGRPTKEIVDNIHDYRPAGTARATALRRLRKDAPELHARVLADELSPHAAMVQAGFRPKTVTVRVDSPESAARTLRQAMSPEDIARMVTILLGGGD